MTSFSECFGIFLPQDLKTPFIFPIEEPGSTKSSQYGQQTDEAYGVCESSFPEPLNEFEFERFISAPPLQRSTGSPARLGACALGLAGS